MPPSPSVVGPRVIKLDWRLPARLRRPVRYDLAKQRRLQRQRDAIVHFERRPIYTEPPSAHPHYRATNAKPTPATSAEQHTGDIYRHSRPTIQLPPPPYQGRFVRQPAVAPTRRVSTTPIPTPLQNRPPARPQNLRRPSTVSSGSNGAAPPVPVAGDRDAPFDWRAYERQPPHVATPRAAATLNREVAIVEQPASRVSTVRKPRRFALPLHFSIFPLRLLPGQTSRQPATTDSAAVAKKKIFRHRALNSAILLVACTLAASSIWILKGAGRGYAAIDSVEQQSRQAYQHLLAAQTALAATDFAASEAEFAQAQLLLQQARTTMQEALAASEIIIRRLDVTGTVRSGEALLAAGEEITQAGQHVARGAAPLFDANFFAAAGSEGTMVDALGGALSEFSEAATVLQSVETKLNTITLEALPADIQPAVATLKGSVPKARELLTSFLNQGDVMLLVLGADRSRQYLLLFQNNHELRPTGGFIGSLALLNVDRGVVEDINVQSAYDGDGQLPDFIAPPPPLLAIAPRWYLRDANWFVDFATSAQKIAEFFEKEGGPTVDGVIALTPEVIKELLQVTGPIALPGYGVTVNQDNFVQLTQDQVTYSYDREQNRPKQFLADLTPLLLNRLFRSPAEYTLPTLGALQHMMSTKHLLLYFRDEAVQERVRALGWGGSFPEAARGFLSVNNANIGGHKSDQFITQEIDYRLDVSDEGDADVTLTIRRTHHGPKEKLDYNYPPGEDPAGKDNIIYQRVLVPTTAALTTAHGFTSPADLPRPAPHASDIPIEPDAAVTLWQGKQQSHPSGTTIGEEAGYTYFANWLVTKPGQTSIGVYQYRLPRHFVLPGYLDPAATYSLYVAKQPGDTRTTLRTELNLPDTVAIVHTVPNDGVTQTTPETMVYRGELNRDTLIGAVVRER